MTDTIVTMLLILAALVLLDVAALRYGADSRRPRDRHPEAPDDDRPDW